MERDDDAKRIGTAGRAGEVFAAFLKLGLTSFGGPVAHLGYFHDEFVVRRRWFDERAYADLVALCQFLPGPASSQVGLSIGLSRAGYLGALAAWTAFTLPSAIALVLFAFSVGFLGEALGSGWLHGLKVAAVAVVAQAVLGMARSLTPDRERATLAVAAAAVTLAFPSAWGQIGSIVLGGIAGLILGWGVGRIINFGANYYIESQGGTTGNLFSLPIWLIASALGFSIFVSLAAGAYPARRAARLEPIHALRHD